MDPTSALLVGAAAFVASTLAAVTGFGGATVLLPVLVFAFGVRDAIPILTVAQLVGNGSRVWFNRRDVEYRVVGWFAVGAVPFALAGGFLFSRAPLPALTRLLGAFLLLVVAIGTEALSTVVMHVTKLVAYRGAGVLSWRPLLTGALLGPVMVLGSWVGKRIVDRIPERVFVLLIEGVMTTAGLLFLVRGR